MADATVHVKGLRELNRAFAQAPKDVRKDWRSSMREVAQPVQQQAQQLALSEIRHMPSSPRWAGMRIGVTRSMVYVAPRQKGVRGRARTARPNLAGLLMDRSLEPALEHNTESTTRKMQALLDRAVDKFNGGG